MLNRENSGVFNVAHCDAIAIAVRNLHDAAVPAHHSLRLRQVIEAEEDTDFGVFMTTETEIVSLT